MSYSGITLASLRRELYALKRKYARVFAVAHLKPVTDHIAELWNIAVAKKKPKPDPIFCIKKIADAGFRITSLKALHIYLKDCRYYNEFPDAQKIAARLFPPKKKVNLSAVLPDRFPFI